MRALTILACLLLTACAGDNTDLEEFIQQVKQQPPQPIEPYPEFKTIPAFKYSAVDQRSPFTRPRNQDLALQDQRQDNCAQPNVSRAKEALEAYGVDALSIQGFFDSKGHRWALVMANDGSLHKATVGNRLGLFFGRITRVSEDTVFFIEQLPDGAGCWQEKQSRLTFNDTTGELTNV